MGAMTSHELEYASFLVRLWFRNKNSPYGSTRVLGHIDHIQREEKYSFENLDDLAGLIRTCLMAEGERGENHGESNH